MPLELSRGFTILLNLAQLILGTVVQCPGSRTQRTTIIMNQTTILLAAALVVGGAGGFLVGSNIGEGGLGGKQSSARELSGSNNRLSTRAADSPSRTLRSGSRSTLRSYEDINRLPGTSNRIEALVQFYQSLSPEQLEEEAKKMEGLPMGERIVASMLLFSRWGEVDAYSAMEYANGLGFAGMMVRPTVLQSWASVDPANAAKYYEKNPREFVMMGGGRGRGGMQAQGGSVIIASEWAKQDPQAAMAWANGLEQGKDEALASVIGEVAREDPAKAADMLQGIDAESAADSYRAIAESYGAKDFAAAQSWIQSLPADQQGPAMAAAISGLARTDPAAAAAQVAAMESGGSKDRAVRDVVGSLAVEDPQAAARFLSENGSADAQEDSMGELIPAWVSKDPGAALDYTMSLEQGEVRDRAIRSYVWSNSSAAPGELVQVAESISDERDRSRTIGWMAARWMREDEAAAKAYIESSESISDRAKGHILGSEKP